MELDYCHLHRVNVIIKGFFQQQCVILHLSAVLDCKKSHFPLHSQLLIQRCITAPYFTGESAECAIMLQQFGPSHYWDRLAVAVKLCISNPRN